MPGPGRPRRLVLALALLGALALAPAAGAGGLSTLVRGGVDLDVRSASGALVGSIRASVDASGEGLGSFRPAPDAPGAPLVVGLRGTLAGSVARLALRGSGFRGRFTVDAEGRASGTGTLAGAAVTLAGAASDAAPSTRRGMEILVVGKPSGEAWQALKAFFRPVAFDPAAHTRAGLLADRARFHRFAGVVFGADVKPSAIRAHALLRAFANAGKWVILAPAMPASIDALAGVHPYDPNRAAAAVAIRATGPEGGLDRVKPTVVYPEIPTAARTLQAAPGVPLTAAQRAAAATRRQTWFLDQLVRLGRGRMASARTVAAARAPAASGFTLPFNAAAIELSVPYYHEVTLTGGQNAEKLDLCGWNQSDWNAWCADTSWYQEQAGPSGNDPAVACPYFLDNGYFALSNAGRLASGLGTKKNGDGAYTVKSSSLQEHDYWYLKPGNACPQTGTQTAVLQGNDYYYAIYDPKLDAHTIVALTDPTVSAAAGGRLFRNNAANGNVALHTYVTTQGERESTLTLKETAWFLGAYVHELALTGPNLGPLSLEYSSAQSFPNDAISVTQLTEGTSTTQGFTVGAFSTDGTGTYTESVTKSTSIEIQAPDWAVEPVPGAREVTYTWETQTDGTDEAAPLAFDTIQSFANDGCCNPTGAFAGAGLSWVPNDISIDDFSPSSLTVWTGAATWGPVTVSSTRTLSLVDHFSWWHQPTLAFGDDVAVVQAVFSDDPNGITPGTKTPAGPGLDLCDPAVVAPGFATECAGGS